MLPILEGLVTTINADGSIHCSPMGPRIEPDWRHFLLRPYRSAHTFQNLKLHGEGVLHVTDDVLMLARSALGECDVLAHRPAEKIKGYIVSDACRFYEFRVTNIDESNDPAQINAEVVHHGSLREFWGFNRAKHAILEATILATRLQFLSLEEVAEEFQKLKTIVEKTGGDQEVKAFAFVQTYLAHARQKKAQP